MGSSVEALHLSARSTTCLGKLNIRYVNELVEKSPTDVLMTPNFGKQSLRDIREKLGAMGLTLGMKRVETSYREDIMATVAARIKAADG